MGRIGEDVTQRLDLVPAGWAGAAGAACVARARAPRCDALHDNGWLAKHRKLSELAGTLTRPGQPSVPLKDLRR